MTANKMTALLEDLLPKKFPIWVWRNNRLNAPVIGRGGKIRRVNAGIDGQGDITGILTVEHAGRFFGVRIEIEVKAGTDRQSAKQKSFEHRLKKMGGCYIIARSVEQCIADVRAFLCAS